jgi:prophage regulatory protein
MQAITLDSNTSLEILSPRELRETLGDLSSTTVWRMRRRGEFPEPIRLSPGRVGYRRADVAAWLEQRSAGGSR